MLEQDIENLMVWTCVGHPEAYLPELKPEFLKSKLLQNIWEKMGNLKSKGQSWDIPLMYTEFEADSDERSWIISNQNEWAPPSLIPAYGKKIIDEYRKRVAMTVMNEVYAEFGFHDPYEFQNRLQRKLADIQPESTIKSAPQIAKELFTHLEKVKENGGLTGINCGFNRLNEFFNGFQPARLYVLAARPSMGKSSLMMNFAVNAAKDDASVYIHCLEESLLAFSSRILSNLSDIDNEQIQRGTFGDSLWPNLARGTDKLSKLKLHVNDRPNITAEKICESIRGLATKQPIDIVFLDHIQDIQRTKDSWHHDISESCGLFKALAKDLNIPVLIVSQLNRGVEARQDKRPILSDLKESGDIEAKADVVFLMYRDEYYNPNTTFKNEVEVRVAKNRDGRVGMFKLRWNPSKMRFTDNIF